MAVRGAILNHMVSIAHFLLFAHMIGYGYSSIQEYIRATNMDRPYTWGTDIEIFTLAHLLQTPTLTYVKDRGSWERVTPHNVDNTLNDDVTQMSMYLNLSDNHFEVVCSIRK